MTSKKKSVCVGGGLTLKGSSVCVLKELRHGEEASKMITAPSYHGITLFSLSSPEENWEPSKLEHIDSSQPQCTYCIIAPLLKANVTL